jgi:four helix bundle protein
MGMAMWYGERQKVYELNAWQKADAFSTLLHDVCRELDLGSDKEWLIYLLQQASQRMPEAVAESWHREHLAECLFSISEALTSLALIDYYLLFLRHEGYLTGERADKVNERLSELQDELTSLVGRLREELRVSPEATLSSFLWHGTSSRGDVISESNFREGLFSC